MKRGEDRDSEQGEGFFLLVVDTRVCPHPLRAGRCGEGTRPCCSTARQLAPTLAQAPARTELSPQPRILFCFFVFIFFLSATNVEDELTCAMLLWGPGRVAPRLPQRGCRGGGASCPPHGARPPASPAPEAAVPGGGTQQTGVQRVRRCALESHLGNSPRVYFLKLNNFFKVRHF